MIMIMILNNNTRDVYERNESQSEQLGEESDKNRLRHKDSSQDRIHHENENCLDVVGCSILNVILT